MNTSVRERITQMSYSIPSHHSSLESWLTEIIEGSDWYRTLTDIRDLNLPDWWVAGGAVRTTAWKYLFKNDCHLKIKDIDLIFFDTNTGRETEQAAKEKLSTIHPDWVFDVKNQSSFGNWRNWPWTFSDTVDGIAHFLHTATAVGVKIDERGVLCIAQPYGLEDLFSGCIRRTPFRQEDGAAERKQLEYMDGCSKLFAAKD